MSEIMDTATVAVTEDRNKSSKWKDRFPLVVLFAINLALVTAVITLACWKKDSVCLTERCVITANRVISSMDRTIDPCVDFYQFACGGWTKSNPVPYWTSSWDRMAALKESLVQDVLQLLEPGELLGGEPAAVKKARVFYRTCMNDTEVSETATRRMRRALANIGLPAHPLNTTTLDWLYVIANIRRSLGFHLLFAFAVNVHVRNSTVHQMTLSQASVGFPEKLLLEPIKYKDAIDYYKTFITRSIEAYTGEIVGSMEFAEDVVKISGSLAQAMTPADTRSSAGRKLYEFNLQQLARGPNFNSPTWRTINWTRYFDILFENVNITLNATTDTVLIYDLPYLERLSEILHNANERTLARYLWWTTFAKFPPVTTELQKLSAEFSEKIHKLRIPKWRICTQNLMNNFGYAISYLYIKTKFDDLNKTKALEILEAIKEAFRGNVQSENWMDTITRKRALEKLDHMRSFVGYPQWVMNISQLDHHYKNVEVINGDKLTTFLNIRESSAISHLEKLRKIVNRNRWMAPTTVNAFYSYDQNLVNVPVGILRPPFFDNGIDAMDYGAVGGIMGHEITHGFDDRGRRFDQKGNLKNWWTNETLSKYRDRVECVIKQYNQYWMPELGRDFKVDGTKTKEENVADNEGIRVAFKAYKDKRKRRGLILPGMPNFDENRLFFLAYAQNWCGTITPQGLRNRLAVGKHSPNRIRVLGTLANSVEFADVWNCPTGSPMNPINKCVLW
ncbi:endothelin-converting enzyme homolog [Onthophagus taurus]|uniref:endothelin-converting enzyme homolog n=1 Tax=Onthophagus taurus TaxID=166361 RepID=UPI0039BE937A